MSRQRLGHAATAHHLQGVLRRCHPTARARVTEELAAAERGEGPTVFDVLVEIIRDHGVGGEQADDRVGSTSPA